MLGSNRGVWPAWLIMFILSLLLGWLPFIGPLIAGVVGGVQAGRTGDALLAAVIPSLIVAAFIFVLGAVLAVPILGAIVGGGLLVVLVIGTIPLLIGAWLGGWWAENNRPARV